MRDVPDVRLTLLGPVGVQVDGSPVDVGGPRPRAVLAILAIAHGELVPAARLIDGLWPEGGPVEPGLPSAVGRDLVPSPRHQPHAMTTRLRTSEPRNAMR